MSWDQEADLVVVGFGGAGAAAAITAHDAGGNVLVLEKAAAAEAHTPSTRMSGGAIMAVTGDLERAVKAMDICAGGLTPIEVTRAWAVAAQDIVAWVNNLKPGYDVIQKWGPEDPSIDGSEAVAGFGGRGRHTGYELYDALRYAAAQRDIEVRYGAAAQRLITDADGRVCGVACDTPDGPKRFGARRGVALTCGGYEFNDEIKKNFLRAHPTHFYGNPLNTGDGVLMAQKVGAQLWHMNGMMGRGMGHFVHPDGREMNFIIMLDPMGMQYEIPPFGYIITDGHGRRFTNETPQIKGGHSFNYEMLAYDPIRREYPRIPSYAFFDERRRTTFPLTVPNLGLMRVGVYDWSADNSQEIAHGWISRGDTIAEAARAAGVDDPQQVEAELRAYNRSCETKSDPYGRPSASLVPLQPPFYCVKLYPGGTNTLGGPRRNENAQIVDPFGDPIPGLYGAGELGGAMGALYPAAGSSISDALCFGRIAGRHAVLGNA